LTPVRLAMVLSVCVFRRATKTCPATAPKTKTAMMMFRVVVKLSGSAGLSGMVAAGGVGDAGGAMTAAAARVDAGGWWWREERRKLFNARDFEAACCVEGVLAGDC